MSFKDRSVKWKDIFMVMTFIGAASLVLAFTVLATVHDLGFDKCVQCVWTENQTQYPCECQHQTKTIANDYFVYGGYILVIAGFCLRTL